MCEVLCRGKKSKKAPKTIYKTQKRCLNYLNQMKAKNMVTEKEGLERLCQVYEALDEGEKEEILRFAEGLLSSLSDSDGILKHGKNI